MAHSKGRYHIFWRSGSTRNECPDSFDDKGRAKSYATTFLKRHYLDDVTIQVRTPDDSDWIPLLIRKRVMNRKDWKPYYGEWEDC